MLDELMEGFATATKENAPMYLMLQEILGDSADLSKATWNGNANRVV